MPEVQEVFHMATQKVRPDHDSLEQQHRDQRRHASRQRAAVFVLVGALVLGAAAVGLSALRSDGTTQPLGPPTASPPPTVGEAVYLDIATGEKTPISANLGVARAVEVAPNGEAVAYNTCCDDTAIYVAQLDGSGTEIITPKKLDGYAPTWIDNKRILFQGRPEGTIQLGDLYVADLSTGEVTMVTDLPDERNGAWIIISDVSPDGMTVLFHLPRGRGNNAGYDLWTAPLAGGEPTLLRESAGYAQYAADGSIVFLDHPVPFEGDEIWIMDGDGSNARRLVQDHGGTFTWPRVSPDGTKVAYGHDTKAEWIDIASGEVTTTDWFSEEPAWYGNDTLIVT
jgi:Tol biopolymer transport system component